MTDSSFEAVFRHYNAGLKVYALRLVRQKEVAEDIVHDIFVKLWAARHRIRQATMKVYLFNSVRNECFKYLEHLKVRSSYQESVLKKGEVPGSLTWEYYVLAELETHVKKALENLSPQQLKIFLMSREEQKTSADIGEELGLSPRTVEKHMEMAMRKMRQDLSEYLPLYMIWLCLFRF